MKDIPNYKHFQNTKCEYYPCHNLKEGEEINCIFCYCPLYLLGDKCGGTFTILDNGIKDCSNCMVPHKDYDYVVSRLQNEYFKK